MRLHWSPKSPYVRKVMVCAHELGIAGELRLERSVAAMRVPNPKIMADNPLSKIPTLVLDDGGTLFDSAVICEYLDTRCGGTLFSREGDARWAQLRWHALGDGLLDMLILWRNERERAVPLADLVDAFDTKTRATLRLLEAEATALRAAPFGIGAVAVGCALGYLDYRFDTLHWRGDAPELAGWWEAVQARPSFQVTGPVEG